MSDQTTTVELSEEPLSLDRAVAAVKNPKAGGISTFVGTTRDTFQGKRVVQLEYEGYEPMAVKELHALSDRLRNKWDVLGIAIYHRLGIVPVSEASVIVAVSSAHRKECIAACHFAIDELKATVPIWKREVYEDGSTWKQNCECAFAKK